MAKFEFLSAFFTERLLAVAGEIFQVVKDTIAEYQEEIDRAKQEKHHLKKVLLETLSSAGADHHRNSRAVHEAANLSQGPLDSESSVINVKVEFCTLQQDSESQELFNDPLSRTSPSTCSNGAPYRWPVKTVHDKEDDGDPYNNSGVTVKLEPLDSQDICSDDPACKMQGEGTPENHLVGLTDGQGPSSRCNMESDGFSQAKTHLQNQPPERAFVCEYCGKPFRNRGQLKQHRAVHQKERPRPYCCDFCGKCYSYAQVLEVHRRTHTGERPFHCKFCGRRFNQKGHLKDHERIHTGEKPFICPVCGKCFIQSSQVRKHIRNNHQAK
ncbi:zinc finger protein 420-like [Electrophorus electricus]|uniref:zinc finger protein 420-like n=1 Tax=Electrophorus electricus TaxID=8005 RepID=UPI0015CFE837|nr:zinc finger protein 420-like [Electrophorus electricus]